MTEDELFISEYKAQKKELDDLTSKKLLLEKDVNKLYRKNKECSLLLKIITPFSRFITMFILSIIVLASAIILVSVFHGLFINIIGYSLIIIGAISLILLIITGILVVHIGNEDSETFISPGKDNKWKIEFLILIAKIKRDK